MYVAGDEMRCLLCDGIHIYNSLILHPEQVHTMMRVMLLDRACFSFRSFVIKVHSKMATHQNLPIQ